MCEKGKLDTCSNSSCGVRGHSEATLLQFYVVSYTMIKSDVNVSFNVKKYSDCFP